MFYEDMRIGQASDFGSTVFTRDAILAFARQFGPRIVAREREALIASGLHVASAAMRGLIETRSALRAAMAARGETMPELGVSPGFRDTRWPHPVREGDVFSFGAEIISKRETSKPRGDWSETDFAASTRAARKC